MGSLGMAQNNAIFSGGSADGYDQDNYQQISNINNIVYGGDGDGFDKDCFMQNSNLNNIMSGGNGDGFNKDCYMQASNLNLTKSAGGDGDGFSKDCYMQMSNLHAIFNGGNGGNGMLAGCANEPLGCFLALNLGNDTTICDGETITLDAGAFSGFASYLWQDSSTAQTFLVDTTGLYYVYVVDTSGCTGIDSVYITVNPMPLVNLGNDTAFCAGNNLLLDAGNTGATYLWQNTATPPYQNQTLTVNTTGIYFVTVSYGICSDADTINVTINPIVTTNMPDSIICQGDSVLIFGNYETIAGTYKDTVVASTGCDSILTQTLIVNPTYNQNLGTVTICSGDSALILGNYETIAGVYTDTLQTINGCDSIITQTLNVDPVHVFDLGNDTVFCGGNTLVLDAGSGASSYLWQNNATPPYQNQTLMVNTTGIYYVNVTLGSCSTSDTINVTVNPIITTNLSDAIICNGDSTLIFGNYESVAGMYRDTIIASTGCDSILTQTLIVNPTYTNNTSTAICQGDSILLGGTYQTIAGVYNDTLSTINGCDSIISTTLSVNPVVMVNQSQAICEGDSILLAGVYQTMPGVYYDSLSTGLGCDSIVETTLAVNPISTDTLAPMVICQGDSALIFGIYQSVAGMYQGTYSGSNSCDSVVTQELIVNLLPMINLGPDSVICEDDSIYLDAGTNVNTYQWSTGDTVQTILVDANGMPPGIYTYYVQGTDSNGCMISDTINVEVSTCSGIDEALSNVKVSIYPNPTKGLVTLTSTEQMKEVELYNVLGEKVLDHETAATKLQLNIDHLNKGVYVVRILYEKGNKVSKLILE